MLPFLSPRKPVTPQKSDSPRKPNSASKSSSVGKSNVCSPNKDAGASEPPQTTRAIRHPEDQRSNDVNTVGSFNQDLVSEEHFASLFGSAIAKTAAGTNKFCTIATPSKVHENTTLVCHVDSQAMRHRIENSNGGFSSNSPTAVPGSSPKNISEEVSKPLVEVSRTDYRSVSARKVGFKVTGDISDAMTARANLRHPAQLRSLCVPASSGMGCPGRKDTIWPLDEHAKILQQKNIESFADDKLQSNAEAGIRYSKHVRVFCVVYGGVEFNAAHDLLIITL